MYRFRICLFVLAGCGAFPVSAAPSFQAVLDGAPSSGILVVPPGTYAGPAVLERPLVVEGGGKVVVQGNGQGTVLTVNASGAVVRGLILRGSGNSHDRLDAAITVTGSGNRIEGNRMDDVLFGIILHGSDHNQVVGNQVRSRGEDSADRGDGLRLWNASYNLIEGNEFSHVRDLAISNSPHNRYLRNRVVDSRRAMNFLFSGRSLVAGNHFERNTAGVVVINSDGFILRNNQILHAMEAGGTGIALKESTAVLVEGNQIVHCAVGIYSDAPDHPTNRLVLHANRLAHNITGISFQGERGGRIVVGNRFEHNLWNVSSSNAGDPENEAWYLNSWDDYQGFDLDGDGLGDTPHEIHDYVDRIWQDTPAARFFRNAPLLELVDFLERLAPFSHPTLVVRDHKPRLDPAPAALSNPGTARLLTRPGPPGGAQP